ncbi:MAG: dephospho-CoA kinase [Campylobacteraceae bacterium]|nr:dephospho-CoA kinase [Campylobacteraceae bacterium]
MRPVIITGGIASGKSTVCEKLAKRGVKIIDADKKAHKILNLHTKEISELFGTKCVKDNIVLRSVLGEIIFKNPSKRKKLEALIHPKVHKALLKEWEKSQKKGELCVLDIPLYFESGQEYPGFFIAVINAKPSQQRARLKKRNNLQDEQVEDRLRAQKPLKFKCENADWVIDNIEDISKLDKKVEDLYNWIREFDEKK